MGDETKQPLPPDGHEQAECPKCGHKFWHKIGHALKESGIAVVEAIGNTIAKSGNLGGDS